MRLLPSAFVAAALVMACGDPAFSPDDLIAARALPLTAGGFTTTARATPALVTAGNAIAIDVSVYSERRLRADVVVDVLDEAGAVVLSAPQGSRTYKARTTRNYRVEWAVPSTQAAGPYAVRVSVFSGRSLQHQNLTAATLTVEAAPAPEPEPAPEPAPAPSEPTVAPLLGANFETSATASFGGVTRAALESAFAQSFDWIVAQSELALVDDGTSTHLRQRYVPTSQGSAVVSFPIPVPSRNELWLSYRVFFEPGWQWVKGGKLPGLAGGTYPTGGAYDDNGFSARLIWRGGGQLAVYAYHHDRPTKYGEDFLLTNADGSSYLAPVGQWVSVRQRIKMNSSGSAYDGEVEVWIDGERKLLRTGLRWRMSTGYAADTLLYSSFYGGADSSWAPTATTYARFDDFLVSDSTAGVD